VGFIGGSRRARWKVEGKKKRKVRDGKDVCLFVGKTAKRRLLGGFGGANGKQGSFRVSGSG
jgi:hypothetical protein